MSVHPQPETARLTADVAVFGNGSSHVLLIRRGHEPFKGHWGLPGGHVDAGEGVEDAARRELAEETGLSVGHLEFVAVYHEPGRDPRGRYVAFLYTAHVEGLPSVASGDDAAGASWVPVRDALAIDRFAADQGRMLRDALQAGGK